MNGLTVRWSLAGTEPGVEERLATYVAQTSHARFSAMAGLRHKVWRSVPGQWFEGCYVFEDDAARAAFQEEFTATAAQSPGSQIIGSPPVLIEACTVVAVAEGASGFVAAARAEQVLTPPRGSTPSSPAADRRRRAAGRAPAGRRQRPDG